VSSILSPVQGENRQRAGGKKRKVVNESEVTPEGRIQHPISSHRGGKGTKSECRGRSIPVGVLEAITINLSNGGEKA